MYEVEGICYAGVPGGSVRVSRAKAVTGGMLLLEFESGERMIFDTELLHGSAFAPLRDPDVLANLKVEHGFVSWLDGAVDVAPEYLHDNALPYNEGDVLLAG